MDLIEDDDDEQFKNLHKSLQKLGFTQNDSKIYITLLKIGLSSPARISEKSQVDRARVYDSLKRLVKRGIVEEEPVPRAPRYRAIPPLQVFGRIRKDYQNRIKLSEDLEKELKNIRIISKEQNSVWAIQGDQKIHKKMFQFLEESNEIYYVILTTDISSSSREIMSLTEQLVEKRNQNPDLKIKIALKVNPDNLDQRNCINRLYHANVEIYNWNTGVILPFGLYLTDQAFMQTFLNSTTPKPKYEFGLFMEKCSKEQLAGFQHLCIWVFTNLCQRVVFQKKKKADDGVSDDNLNDQFNDEALL